MEFAAAAVAAIGSMFTTGATAAGAGATAAAGASAAASAGAAAGAGSSLFSMGSLLTGALSGGLSLMSAMQAAKAGKIEAAQMQMQADAARQDATQASLDGEAKQSSMRRDLVAELGRRDVAYAASGVDVSFGTPAQASAQAMDDAYAAMNAAGADVQSRVGRYRTRAAMYEAAGADRLAAGYAKGGGLLLSSALDIVKRG